MRDRWTAEEDRISRFLDGRLRSALHPRRIPLDISVWPTIGEPAPVRIALRADYAPFLAGDRWGRPWSTTWSRLRARVPERWTGRRVEALVDLGSGDLGTAPAGPAEALVHDASGIPLQGLRRAGEAVTVSTAAGGGEHVHPLLEAAATPFVDARAGVFTRFGNPATAGDEPLYRLRFADLAVRDEGVWQLIHDVEALSRLMHALPTAEPRRHRIRAALVRAADAVDPHDIAGTAHRARSLLVPELARQAGESALPVITFGHARIDFGWLPAHESVRQAARAFASAVSLAEEYPELVFAASSAQYYAWMRDHQPHIFERIRKAVADAVDHPDIVVEAVKLADDRSGDVVVRLYEARGGRARTTLTAGFALASVRETDLLEKPLAAHPHHDGDVTVSLRPFQILTLRLAVGGNGA